MGSTLVLVVGLVAIAISLMTLVLAVLLGSGQLTGTARSLAMIEHRLDRAEVAKQDLPLVERLVLPVLAHTRRLAYRLSPNGAADKLSHRLDVAGNPARWTAERMMGAKGAGLIIGPVLAVLFLGFTLRGLLVGLAAAAAGFLVPDLLLYNAGLKRQDLLRRGLADALDMLTVCVEAGQSFDGALQQVAKATTGPVAGEFARVLSEIQIGKSRGDAFGSLAQRTTVPEAKNFVTALVQADRLGLPIAGVLKEQSIQMRLVRRQRAEEQAQKVPVKIVFPMLFCIFPALFVVIIGPGAIRIVEAFTAL